MSERDDWDEDEEDCEDCDGCKFWSELCAASIGCGPMNALCLNAESPYYSKMVHGGCGYYTRGTTVDCPVN